MEIHIFFVGMFIAQYLQGLTPNLAVGADIIYQRSPVRQNSIVSFAARYRSLFMRFVSYHIFRFFCLKKIYVDDDLFMLIFQLRPF